eukprot:scaffold1501_cov130-Cylindrotheca_fusiformis.AAC.5
MNELIVLGIIVLVLAIDCLGKAGQGIAHELCHFQAIDESLLFQLAVWLISIHKEEEGTRDNNDMSCFETWNDV